MSWTDFQTAEFMKTMGGFWDGKFSDLELEQWVKKFSGHRFQRVIEALQEHYNESNYKPKPKEIHARLKALNEAQGELGPREAAIAKIARYSGTVVRWNGSRWRVCDVCLLGLDDERSVRYAALEADGDDSEDTISNQQLLDLVQGLERVHGRDYQPPAAVELREFLAEAVRGENPSRLEGDALAYAGRKLRHLERPTAVAEPPPRTEPPRSESPVLSGRSRAVDSCVQCQAVLERHEIVENVAAGLRPGERICNKCMGRGSSFGQGAGL